MILYDKNVDVKAENGFSFVYGKFRVTVISDDPGRVTITEAHGPTWGLTVEDIDALIPVLKEASLRSSDLRNTLNALKTKQYPEAKVPD